MTLPFSSVLITGATGFIGGRLAERLVVDYHLRPRVLVRDPRRLTWLSRMPVDVVPGEVTDAAALERACTGVDVVFHCAASGSADYRAAYATNVEGTRTVLTAAQRHGVGRLVHLSSTVVHGEPLPPGLSEDSPLAPSPDAYAQTKARGEQAVWDFSRATGLPVTVVRPALVYGPRSATWTIAPAAQLLAGKAAVVGDGSGIANLVYVDNLVDLLLRAASEPRAVGRAYLAADGEGITWRRFWDAFAVELRSPPPPSRPVTAIAVSRTLNRRTMRLSDVAARHGNGNVGLGLQVATKVARRLTSRLDMLGSVPLGVYRCQTLVEPARARDELGYRPRVCFAQGLRDCGAWLRFHGYVPGYPKE